MKVFDIAGCNVTGSLPTEVGRLRKLEVLNLYGNSLTSTIPTELGGLGNLEELILSNNGMAGTIPTWLGKLSDLKGFDVGGNGFNGAFPSELGKLDDLHEVFIGDNGFTGDVGFLCNSDSFFFDESEFPNTDCTTSQADKIKKLYDGLGLQNYNNSVFNRRSVVCDWTGITCDEYEDVTKIELAGRSLSGTIDAVIGQISWLELVDLSNNQLDSTIPPSMENLMYLESLKLNMNELTGDASFFCGLEEYVTVLVDAGEVDICTPAPSLAPSVSSAPSVSAAPSLVPSVSLAPSLSALPSLVPTISWYPTSSYDYYGEYYNYWPWKRSISSS